MPTKSIQNLCWAAHKHAAVCLIWATVHPCFAANIDGWKPPAVADQQSEGVPVIPIAGTVYKTVQFQERLLSVDINRQQLDQTVLVLEDASGMLYLWSQDLQRWRFRQPPERPAIQYQGETYYPLKALSDLLYRYDTNELTLTLEVRSDAFVSTRLTNRYDDLQPPARPDPGGFINYDLYFSRTADTTQRSGLFELGYFNSHGVGVSNVLVNQLVDLLQSTSHLTRLDTTWTIDAPEKLRTLRFGDAINVAGSWGRSVRFGGIQYGSNFATQPGFVSFPSQSIAGQAVLPSTVDVFVNNALVSRQNVPPGPFSISNLPIVTGAGEVQLVVRDLMGREQIISRPFYASQALLRKGLKTFSFELGFVRENFGLNSNVYGGWLASGTYRRGLTDTLTGETHAEAMAGQTTAGVGADYLVAQVGTLSTYAVGSHSRSGSGGLMLAGIKRQADPWSLGAHMQWASSGFAQVGQRLALPPPILSNSLSLSYAAGLAGAVSLAYVAEHNRQQADTRIATASYSVALGALGTLTVSALRNLTGDASTTVFALLSMPLGGSSSLSFSAQSVRGPNAELSTAFTTTHQRNLPMGEGYGYRLQARSDNATQASLSLQNNLATSTLELAQSQGVTATRLGVSGGVAILGGNAFPSRRIDQSFAVVRIPDYPNVHILTDNQPAGRTDANGNALIPQLRAYDVNVISIDQRDLPMDAQISALKVEAVPYFRSGIEVPFPIKFSNSATFRIQFEDGTPMPVGASVQEIGHATIHPVGYGGEVYVVGLHEATRLRATWNGQSCDFTVSFTRTADPLPDLGIFVCQGVSR
jgi:outer membrane usher protein